MENVRKIFYVFEPINNFIIFESIKYKPMKRIVLLIACLSLTFFIKGQDLFNPLPAGKSSMDLLKNGKIIFKKEFNRNPGSTAVSLNPELNVQKKSMPQKKNQPERSKAIYHVVFHFDQPVYILLLNGFDTSYSNPFNLTVNGTLAEGDITEGYYYLFAEMDRATGSCDTLYQIFQSGFHVYKDMDTVISSSSASHLLTLSMVDENGVEVPEFLHGGHNFGYSLQFPEGYNAALNSRYCGFRAIIKANDVLPGIKILWAKSEATQSYPYHDYFVSYPVITELYSDTIFCNDPADYRYFPVVMHPSPSFQDSYLGFGFGIIYNELLYGSPGSDVSAWVDTWYHGTGTESETVHQYISGTACDTNLIFFAGGIVRQECQPGPDCGYPGILSPVFYLSQDNEMILSCNGNYPPVEGDYRVISGTRIDLGNNAPFNRTYSYNMPGSSIIHVSQSFKDESGGRRNADVVQSTYDIWQGNDHLFHDSITGYEIQYYTPGPGWYSLILNDSNWVVNGRPGYLQSNLTFDLGAEDAVPPTLVSFRIMKSDSISTELIHGYPASVEFTGAHYVCIPPDYIWWFIDQPSDVFLQYKEYSDSVWTYLDIIPQYSGWEPFCGMPYYADLQPVLDEFPDSAWIDLRIDLIDSSGNYTLETMHPAFLVRDALTGSDHISASTSFSIYPNPAIDRIHVQTDEEDYSLAIFTMTGTKVMDFPNKQKSIDISGLPNGVYIVRLNNNITGRISYSKFIK